ncbi:MAG: YeeE/YedE family protein [Patescibacteria group bacterium]
MGEFLIVGFVTGILLGFILRRGFFCMYNGFANMVITKDYRIIRATIWAFLLTMLSFHTLSSLGIVALSPKPFFWVGSIVGAIVFALGMVLAGSCIVGTPLRAASGKIGYWFTLLGMGIGGWAVIWGPLASFKQEVLQDASKVMLGDKVPTLDILFGVNHWIIVAILSAISIWLLFKLKNKNSAREARPKFFTGLWTPLAIGIGLAIVEVIALVSGKSPAGLGGFIKGWGFYFNSLFTGELPFGWPVAEVTGILVGVFLAAIIAKEFRIVLPKWKQVPRLFFGGIFMGLGAVTAAGGCNVAHIITHMPQLSIGSFVSGFTIIITATILISFIFKRNAGIGDDF